MRRRLLFMVMLLILAAPVLAEEKEKWPGIDEAVVEKYAADRGRAAAEPLIPVEGDLLLFVFTVAGGLGGFVMGYYWHKIFVAGREGKE